MEDLHLFVNLVDTLQDKVISFEKKEAALANF